MAQGFEPKANDLSGDPSEQRYGSMTFEGAPSKSLVEAANTAKRRQGRLAFLVFVAAGLIACGIGFLGLDDASGRVSLRWQGGYFRGGLMALTVLAGTFLAWRIANDSITVRGSRK
jgi:hypothetical protein